MCGRMHALTFVTLGVVGDKSLNDHIPQRLIDRLVCGFDYFGTLARVAGVQANIHNVRLHYHSCFSVCVREREREKTCECHCEVFPCLVLSDVELPFDAALGKRVSSVRL